MSKSLESLWQAAFGPTLKNAGPLQRQEMRKAFFYGAANALRLVLAIVSQQPEQKALRCLDELQREVEREIGIKL